MVSLFKRATKKQSKLRMAISGPSGSGKTYSSLSIGSYLAEKCDGRLAVIDTERGSASKYADIFDFDCVELENDYSLETYTEAIKAAERAGYKVLVIDSLSHSWSGRKGALEMVDAIAKRSNSGNSFAAWREANPKLNDFIDTILACKCHVIATMRTKTEWVVEKNEKGKAVPRKIGMSPVIRDGIEYEFDIFCEMDLDNNLCVTKSRCITLSGEVFNKPDDSVAELLFQWLSAGIDPIVLQAQKKESLQEMFHDFDLDPLSLDICEKLFDWFTESPEQRFHQVKERIGRELKALEGALV